MGNGMKRHLAAALMLGSALGLAGCDKASNKATPARLDALLANGVNPEKLAKVDARMGKALARKNSLAGLAGLGDSAVTNPASAGLKDLLAATMEHNPDIATAAQNVNRADAQRMAAIFGYLPQLTASYQMTQVQTQVIKTDNAVFALGKAQYPVTNMGVQLRQPLIDMSRIFGLQLASTARTGAEATYIAAVKKAIYQTFDAYLVASASRVRIDELRRRARLLDTQITGEGALSGAGLNDEQTVRSLQAEQARVLGDLSVESARYADALGELAYLSGVALNGIQPGGVPNSVMGTERRTTVDAAVEAALKNNPELTATAIKIVELDLQRKKAIASDFMPVLDMIASLDREDRKGSRFGGGSLTQDLTAGVQLRIPIFNGDGTGYSTLEANVDLRDGVIAYHATKRRLETDIAMTLDRMKQLSTAIGQLSKAAAQARANVAAEQSLIANGQSVELRLVSRQVLESQLKEEADAQRIEYLRAWAKLQYLTGAISVDVAAK